MQPEANHDPDLSSAGAPLGAVERRFAAPVSGRVVVIAHERGLALKLEPDKPAHALYWSDIASIDEYSPLENTASSPPVGFLGAVFEGLAYLFLNRKKLAQPARFVIRTAGGAAIAFDRSIVADANALALHAGRRSGKLVTVHR